MGVQVTEDEEWFLLWDLADDTTEVDKGDRSNCNNYHGTSSQATPIAFVYTRQCRGCLLQKILDFMNIYVHQATNR
jgi:hypothetical protein